MFRHSLFLFLFILQSFSSNFLVLVDSTRIQGEIMAFIDINADLFTDLVVCPTPNSLTVYVAQSETVADAYKQPGFKEDTDFRQTFDTGARIVNIGVGDFDGDSYPDLAVSLWDETIEKTSKCGAGRGHQIKICYGSLDGFSACKNLVEQNSHHNGSATIVCEQPLILDCDVDQRSDLLTTIHRGDRDRLEFVCFCKNKNKTGEFDVCPFIHHDENSKGDVPLFVPYNAGPSSHAFVDVSGDLNPEIVLWTEPKEDELIGLRVLQLVDHDGHWEPMNPQFMPSPTPTSKVNAPKLMNEKKATKTAKSNYLVGQSIYDDFNKDGLIDHLLPFCETTSAGGDCETLSFRVWVEKAHWNTPVLTVPLVDDKKQRWAVYKDTSDPSKKPTFHIRSGDYTQDGYPDLIMILEQIVTDDKSTERKRAAILLENVACDAAGEVCADFSRSFRPWWKGFEGSFVELTSSVSTAGFFDLGEDGTLDVLLEYKNASDTGPVWMEFSTSVFEGDTTFLKVQVFTGTCLNDCRFSREGSAISLPGAALFYTSTDAEGKTIRGAYTQRSLSSYRPLLLPYALFGLGRTPNFVEKLSIGVPSWPLRNKSWEQLVPNSRIYVIPYPIDEPKYWVHRLYITPNKLIMYSLISLSSVCALIIIVVFGLHMQERRMDQKERELQRERFHFDAM